jgi:hypothetical protein
MPRAFCSFTLSLHQDRRTLRALRSTRPEEQEGFREDDEHRSNLVRYYVAAALARTGQQLAMAQPKTRSRKSWSPQKREQNVERSIAISAFTGDMLQQNRL